MKPDNNDSPSTKEYFSYSDPFRSKDLIWDAYHGFVYFYNLFCAYKSAGKSGRAAMSGLVKYAWFFYGETKDFYDKFCTTKEDKESIVRLEKLFNGVVIKPKDDDISFMRRFFSYFMVKSGIKNIVHEKDTRKPTDKLLDKRYPDINGGS